MFSENIYIQRRLFLKKQLKSGLIILLGNQESPINYSGNNYPFRQDSSFLYYFGLDTLDLVGIIDIDNDLDIIFGDDITTEDAIWTKAEPPLCERGKAVGVRNIKNLSKLNEFIKNITAKQRTLHILPPYRPEHTLTLNRLTGIEPAKVQKIISKELIKAVIAQRSCKSDEEIQQIEEAIDITRQMHIEAMKLTQPGIYEAEVAAAIEKIAHKNGVDLSYPTIFTTEGQILHNHTYNNLIKDGSLIVNDSGAESKMHYAGDITRTIPANGKFNDRQEDIYKIVLEAQQKAIESIKPGIEFVNIHLFACEIIATGLSDLGLMKGDVKQAVQSGAHALFFPHGLGHMLGLDVHDMESLGEDFVGYTDTIKRSTQFGLSYLRLAKALEPGFVITVEPGIYFIPQLIDQWKADRKFEQYINYEMVEKYKDFGGIRIEDDILVTDSGYRVLGKPVPKTIEKIEETCVK